MKFGYVVRNSIDHTFTVGILEIIFVEGKKESHEDNTRIVYYVIDVLLCLDQSV